MVKVINLNQLDACINAYNTFSTVQYALVYLQGLANAFSVAGYRIENIPVPCDSEDKSISILKAVRDINDDSEQEVLLFALVPVGEKENICITRNRAKDFWETEDEGDYEIECSHMTIQAMASELVNNGCEAVKAENGIAIYKSETDSFVSHFYII